MRQLSQNNQYYLFWDSHKNTYRMYELTVDRDLLTTFED